MTIPRTPDTQGPPLTASLIRIGQAIEVALDQMYEKIARLAEDGMVPDAELAAFLNHEYGDLGDWYLDWIQSGDEFDGVPL